MVDATRSKSYYFLSCRLTFRERTFPTLHTRVFPSHSPSASASAGVFHFFEGLREKTNEVPHLLQAGLSNTNAKLIAEINKHKPELSALGILPNQLRTLLKGTTHAEEALVNLRQTLFWKGFI